MRNIIMILFAAGALLFAGCNRTKPQSPSNRHGSSQEDSVAVAIVLMHQRMAEQADREILDYVKANNPETFAAFEFLRTWSRILVRTDNEKITDNTPLDLRLVVYDLSGSMLFDSREQLIIKDRDFIPSVRVTLLDMNIGEQAELLTPWYAAYGSTGNADVPPYTNLRIIIETYPL